MTDVIKCRMMGLKQRQFIARTLSEQQWKCDMG